MKDSDSPRKPLADLYILVTEDEMLVAMMLEDLLTEDFGCHVIVTTRVPKAVALARTEAFDGAILDVNIAGEKVYPVAEELRRRGIPFILATGYGLSGVEPDFRDGPALSKPYDPAELERAMLAAFVTAPG